MIASPAKAPKALFDPPVSKTRALCPNALELLVVLMALRAFLPKALLLDPLVLVARAPLPKALESLPVWFWSAALVIPPPPPNAQFAEPV